MFVIQSLLNLSDKIEARGKRVQPNRQDCHGYINPASKTSIHVNIIKMKAIILTTYI